MYELILIGAVLLLLAILVVQVMVWRRLGQRDPALAEEYRALGAGLERIERELREEFARARQEAAQMARGGREEQGQALDRLGQTLAAQVARLAQLQAQQLEAFAQQLARLTQSNDQRFEQLRLAVEARLGAIQADNANRLEEMRKTVDEKLHATLEQRLPQMRLQLPDAMTDRRQRQMQGLRRRQKAAETSSGFEGGQGVEGREVVHKGQLNAGVSRL